MPTIKQKRNFIMNIETYGAGERLKIAARLARSLCLASHLVLLPVPTTKDKKHVFGTDILLSDTICNIDENSIVVGYGLPQSFVSMINEHGSSVLDLSCDEEYLCDNAYITAVGALGYILTTVNKSPDDIHFGIVGYGRIGSRLVRMLLFLGARVKIYTSKVLNSIQLGECGIDCVSVSDSDAYDFSGIDILINTAPKDMRDAVRLGLASKNMRIVELASGDNFKDIEGVERLPGIPEKMFCESAGRTYFSAVERFINTAWK